MDPRVQFAAERTLLAWIRTGLALMGFGFVVARFSLLLKELIQVNQTGEHKLFQTPGLSLWIGVLLVTSGVLINLISSFRYAREMKRLRAGFNLIETDWPLGRIVAIGLAIIGIIMVGYLIQLGVQVKT